MKRKNEKPEILTKKERETLTRLLSFDKNAYKAFEEKYHTEALELPTLDADNLFDLNSRDMSKQLRTTTADDIKRLKVSAKDVASLVDRIVDELVRDTKGLDCLPTGHILHVNLLLGNSTNSLVTREDILSLPEKIRPQLTSTLMQVDIAQRTYQTLLSLYYEYLTQKDPRRKKVNYDMFRSGLDVLDLDPVTYEILGMNRNSMGYWLPAIAAAVSKHCFFKIPTTRVVRVPLPLLQLTRLDYNELTPTTLKIVDDWAMKAFELDVNKSYFIKTGVFSSKYDFRNVKVVGQEEVRTLGEYLLFIHHQTTNMASALSSPSIYGAATTNEWVVREFIEDKENNPCIYKGLPLHTEYRVFVDFDVKEVLGVSPYWEPNTMRKHFEKNYDKSVHDMHDYQIFQLHEPILSARYNANVNQVVAQIEELLPDTMLSGQWSVDIMQNGNDFWLIDMAEASNSALRECVPQNRLRRSEELWLPDWNHMAYIEGEIEEGEKQHAGRSD